jgi:flagellin
MRINQNIAAMNAYRNLSVTQGQQSRSLERLSSGFRINRAADDAAGLAISEKLRGQVGGLNQAVTNAQNGISLIQTAEGALNESHSILQRMRELAVQSANDTNTDADRAQIQKEVDQLSQELSRIGASTEFNTKKLLDGSLADDGLTFQIGANEGQTLNVKVGDVRGFALGAAGEVSYTDDAVLGAGAEKLAASSTYTVVADAADSTKSYLVDSSGTKVANGVASGSDWVFTVIDKNGTAADEQTYTFDGSVRSGTVTVDAAGAAKASDTRVANKGLEGGDYTISGTSVEDSSGNVVGSFDTTTGNVKSLEGAVVATLDTDATAFTVGGTDVSTSAAAQSAITTIQSAIDSVSDQRSTLGAVQNRLDHTINNLNVAAENLSASESRIRDTDMAAEMMSFTRAQILSQAGTAMLAQANQVPQSVLSLLR